MGWKAIKEHYDIGHIVQVVPSKGICIGSAYIHDIIVISPEGKIIQKHDYTGNGDLKRYLEEFEADPAKLKELVESKDRFEKHIPVFTYEEGKIVKRFCEELEWPNVTHDGFMMYENTYSTDRNKVIEWAIRNAQTGVTLAMDHIEEKREALKRAQDRLAKKTKELESYTRLKDGQSS
jgi:hypothetical protein